MFGKKGKFWLAIAGALAGLGLFSVISWGVIDSSIEQTSSAEFCAGCHTMQPMINAWEQDSHGGNNPFGFQASCTDCHLPHEGKFSYLYAKIAVSAHDIWSEMVLDTAAIDWEKRREERERFVYDSGCMHCHKDLEEASEKRPAIFIAHKPYFLKKTEKQCVSCHENVGHKDLTKFLNQSL